MVFPGECHMFKLHLSLKNQNKEFTFQNFKKTKSQDGFLM